MSATEEPSVWEELAALINQQSPEARHRYRSALRRWMHDMRHNLGLLRTTEGLVRREAGGKDAIVVDQELLNIAHDAVQEAMTLLEEMRSLPQAIEDTIDGF